MGQNDSGMGFVRGEITGVEPVIITYVVTGKRTALRCGTFKIRFVGLLNQITFQLYRHQGPHTENLIFGQGRDGRLGQGNHGNRITKNIKYF